MAKKILVIDDDSDILDAIKLMLEFAGFAVDTTTRSGEYVWKKLGHRLPDAILLDVLLSGKDGRTVAKELKSNERTSHIPIIMMSAHPNMRQSAIASGANEFIPKPFEMDDLINTLNKFTG